MCSPGRCRLGKAAQGWQTSGRCHRYDGCRCNYHTMHSRNLRGVKTQRDDIMHHLWKIQTQVLPGVLVGCRQSVGTQGVAEHWGAPLTQVQMEQGPSGCHVEPSSYSTSSSTQATRRLRTSSVFVLGCTGARARAFTSADGTADVRIYDGVGAFEGRALLFPANNTTAL